MNNGRKLAALLALGSILLSSAARVSAADPFTIDVIASLTGPGAFLGKNEVAALLLLEQTTDRAGGIRGRPIHFAVGDDQSNPQVDVQLATEIIARKAPIIIGPSLAAGCNAIEALLKNDGPVLYCFTPGSHPKSGSFGFVGSISTYDLIAVNLRYFRDRGWRKIAMITTTDASGQDGEAGVYTELQRPEFKSLALVSLERYAVNDQTVVAQIARIKASGAQAMLAWGTGSPIGTVFHGLSDVGLDIPIGVTAGNLIYPLMKQYENIIPAQFMSATPPAIGLDSIPRGPLHEAVRRYVETFAAQGVRVDLSQALGWDPGTIAIEAYRKLGLSASAQQIKDYVENLHDFAGANGNYDFRDGSQRGLTEKDAIMVRWDASKDTWIAISKLGGAPLK